MTAANPRPRIVTISVVLWLVWLVGCVLASVVGFVEFPSSVLVTVVSVVLSLVVWGLVAWAVLRVSRGSATARIALVVVAVARALLSLGNGPSTLLLTALSAAAAVLLFVPAARPFFTRR
ncbi:vacuolar-type H+-ATPase subunit I/STV1 [Curtobacterium luteum]|uniref:Vacuolar-type H+-ATPase subunit I/STV1 n=1 Tax=Curtobacterium luteum TaxID=33881 RepID=A0A8H9KZE8_9MICO|nr:MULTISPECIES: hypothetical protein [Curtobacterium]MBM7803423.1 vacuolar-type H+-ATPase subunit I/STV1 [Curtobacterium luteum]NUU49587.1 hypothetical protein [Curtobacterium luteum]GGL11147.1 hypothetical protein GCM10009769_31520 [Curtobacterium luteum]